MKGKNELQELLILIILAYFMFQCVFTDNVTNAGHEMFNRMGVLDEIEKLDEYFLGE